MIFNTWYIKIICIGVGTYLRFTSPFYTVDVTGTHLAPEPDLIFSLHKSTYIYYRSTESINLSNTPPQHILQIILLVLFISTNDLHMIYIQNAKVLLNRIQQIKLILLCIILIIVSWRILFVMFIFVHNYLWPNKQYFNEYKTFSPIYINTFLNIVHQKASKT